MFDEELVSDLKQEWKIWSDLIKSRYEAFKSSSKLEVLLDSITEKPIAFIVGAKMSSLSNRFWDMWNEYKDVWDKISENPNDISEFIDLFAEGGIKLRPEKGIGSIPNLVQKGMVPVMMVFNYNCHIELCLSICGIGYTSESYNGPLENELVEVGKPICKILKPHGSSRLEGEPTFIVWPNKEPKKNHSVLSHFVDSIKENNIEHIVILGWSGKHDPHLKPYLQSLKNDLGVRFIHVDKYRPSFKETVTYQWKIVEKNDIIQYLKDGARDFLIGLLKHVDGETLPCTLVSNPLSEIQNHLSTNKPTRKRIVLKNENQEVV